MCLFEWDQRVESGRRRWREEPDIQKHHSSMLAMLAFGGDQRPIDWLRSAYLHEFAFHIDNWRQLKVNRISCVSTTSPAGPATVRRHLTVRFPLFNPHSFHRFSVCANCGRCFCSVFVRLDVDLIGIHHECSGETFACAFTILVGKFITLCVYVSGGGGGWM